MLKQPFSLPIGRAQELAMNKLWACDLKMGALAFKLEWEPGKLDIMIVFGFAFSRETSVSS